MTKKVFNWRALLGLALTCIVVAATIPPLLVYLGWIDASYERVACIVCGAIVGGFWPYPMFIEKEIN